MNSEEITHMVHGPLHGPDASPMGMEALTLALAGGFEGTSNDSVAAGLHDIASAIWCLAKAVDANNKQKNDDTRKD